MSKTRQFPHLNICYCLHVLFFSTIPFINGNTEPLPCVRAATLWFQKISIPPPQKGSDFPGGWGVNLPNFPVGRGVHHREVFPEGCWDAYESNKEKTLKIRINEHGEHILTVPWLHLSHKKCSLWFAVFEQIWYSFEWLGLSVQKKIHPFELLGLSVRKKLSSIWTPCWLKINFSQVPIPKQLNIASHSHTMIQC